MYSLKRPSETDTKMDLLNFVLLEELVEMVANMQFDQNFSVSRSGRTMQVSLTPGAGEAGLDMTHIDFGYDITDTTNRFVSINPGIFRHGQSHYSVLGAVDLEATTSPSYCYVEYIRGITPTIKPLTHDLNATISDTTAYRHLLYTFTISSTGGLEEPTIHHLGGIFIGSYWA